MTHSELAQFVDALSTNEALKEKLAKAVTVDDVLQVAKDAGFDISAESITELQAKMTNEISEGELEKVSGGTAGQVVDTALKINEYAETIAFGLCLMKKGSGYIRDFMGM